MPDDRIAEFSGVVTGAVRGRAVRGEATMKLGERGLAIVVEQGELRLPYGRIDGWVLDAQGLSIRITGGDAIVMASAHGPRALAESLASHACVLPELTRGLRSLGSSRWRADVAQSTIFAPLLAARRRAARMRGPAERVQALDAEVLRREVDGALRAVAASRVRQEGPERRALLAALEDAAVPMRGALEKLGRAADAHGRAAEERRLAAWRQWTEAARDAFAAADACWPALRSALEGAHQPQARWRRWMGSSR